MIKKIKLPLLVLLWVVATMTMLASCKGRTVDNMVPKGETVEVVIAPSPDLEIDTSANISNKLDSLQNEN